MPAQNDGLRLLRHLSELRFEEELRGYSKSQVDRVLQKLAPLGEELDVLQVRLGEAETRAASAEARLLERGGSEADVAPPAQPSPPVVTPTAETVPETPPDFDETLRKTLLLAQRTADETVKEASEEADRVKEDAQGEADQLLTKVRTEADQIESETDRRRTELIGEAESERARLLEEAQADAEQRRQELEAALDEAEGSERAELLEQIANLQEIRRLLTTDIENLEGHLASRRDTIQTAIDDISAVLDDPSQLRSELPPETAAVGPVDPADYDDVSVIVDTLPPASADSIDTESEGDEPDDSADATSEDPAGDSFEHEVVDLDEPTDAGPAPDAAGPPTRELSVEDLPGAEADDPMTRDPWGDDGSPAHPTGGGDASRPTWAEAVPDAPVTDTLTEAAPGATIDSSPEAAGDSPPPPVAQDPFLDELRRATSEESSSDEALERFLDGDIEDEDRKTWFGRRR